MADSCLVQSYDRLVSLSEADRTFLRVLEEHPQDVSAGAVVAEQGSACNDLFVVSSGWCASEITDDAGHCQIVDIHLPGDIIGTREVAFARRLSTLRAVTDATVCPFPRSRLNTMFQQAPRLSGVFVLIAMRREAILSERIFDLGRRDALSRVCHFLLEIKQRLEDSCTLRADRFEMPLTQQQLADALGLTSVHISRVVRRLRETSVVDMRRGQVRILDARRLKQLARMNEEYLDLDTSWIEGASPLAVDPSMLDGQPESALPELDGVALPQTVVEDRGDSAGPGSADDPARPTREPSAR